MPYFKPFPVPDESDLRRFGGGAQTVVRRCTGTLILKWQSYWFWITNNLVVGACASASLRYRVASLT